MKLDKLDTENRGELRRATLVVCEGKRDASFILHLAEQRGIPGIQVGFPDPVTSNQHGKDGFREYLVKLRARTGFKNLRHVVMLRDRNGDANQAFQEVVDQIRGAGHYDIPVQLEQETSGVPGITVRLIPDTQTAGNLDVLLLSSINLHDHPAKNCFTPYFDCCRLHNVDVGKAAKIKLTTIVAASCHRNPSCSLVFVWSEPGNPIPLNSPQFNDIENFLRRFV